MCSGHCWAFPSLSPDKQHEIENIVPSYTEALQWSLLHRDISLEKKVKPNQQISYCRADWGSFDCTIYEMAVTQGVLLKLLCASKSLRSKHKKLKYETDVKKKKTKSGETLKTQMGNSKVVLQLA